MNCDVSFSLGSVSTLFWVRWTFLSCRPVCETFLAAYNSAKNYRNRARFSRVMITNVLPLFMVYSVSQYSIIAYIHYIHYIIHTYV